mgnify:FL=1|tara:strand:+ start:82 stop:795 length:714 start_codon:yes stop_codon:yes gene_type:complete
MGNLIDPYRFVPPAEWDYDHDFSSDDGLWSFANASSTNQVDTSAGVLRTDTTSSNAGGTNRACSGDIMEGTVSDTAWCLQIDSLNYSNKAGPAQNSFGMSASNYSVPSYTASIWQPSDLLYYYMYSNGSADDTHLGYTAGGTDGNGNQTTSEVVISASTNYFIQTIRTSATSATGQTGTNSDFTSPAIDIENTIIPSSIGGLRYAKFGNLIINGFSEGAMVGSFSAFRFADGVTTPP